MDRKRCGAPFVGKSVFVSTCHERIIQCLVHCTHVQYMCSTCTCTCYWYCTCAVHVHVQYIHVHRCKGKNEINCLSSDSFYDILKTSLYFDVMHLSFQSFFWVVLDSFFSFSLAYFSFVPLHKYMYISLIQSPFSTFFSALSLSLCNTVFGILLTLQ